MPVRGLACLAVVLVAAAATLPLPADDRSTELLRYECSSSLGRRDVTLFANGTVRLRQGPWDDQALYLDELLHEELASYVKRLREVRTAASPPGKMAANVPSGEWVEDCRIRLALPGAEPVTYAFSAYEIPPLAVASLIHVAEDLADFTRPPARAERLPEDYRPRPGDVLRTAQGRRFRVVDLTGDELGVELEEIDMPVMMVVSLAELEEMFAALEDPGRR